jgi:hypothetical protein
MFVSDVCENRTTKKQLLKQLNEACINEVHGFTSGVSLENKIHAG